MHHDPQYYRIRDCQVDFQLECAPLHPSGAPRKAGNPLPPPVVTPGSLPNSPATSADSRPPARCAPVERKP